METLIDNNENYDFLPERKFEIAKKALMVFKPYAPVEKSNLHKLPVTEIIKRFDIVIIPYSIINNEQLTALRAVSPEFTENGLFYKNNEGKAFIYYNDQKPIEVCELILFHELGHLLLEHTQQSNFAEREADFFAAVCFGYISLLRQIKKEAA